MRPPPQRNFVGVAMQHRPSFGTAPGVSPAPYHVATRADHNKDSLMYQSCIRGHEQQALPLLETNRFRSKSLGDYSRSAPNPRLGARPKGFSKPLVKTFE